MFKIIKNLNGQGIAVQYATTFAIVLIVALAMSTYFKRIVQSRYSGAREYADKTLNGLFNNNSLNIVGEFRSQYEPYYQQTQMLKESGGEVVDREYPALTPGQGIHSKEYIDYKTSVQIFSNQLAPKDAD